MPLCSRVSVSVSLGVRVLNLVFTAEWLSVCLANLLSVAIIIGVRVNTVGQGVFYSDPKYSWLSIQSGCPVTMSDSYGAALSLLMQIMLAGKGCSYIRKQLDISEFRLKKPGQT